LGGRRRRFVGLDRKVDPTGLAINGDEEVAMAVLICELWQILDVDVDVAYS
jgi:hypothetical protein